ncbi:hypothetical protein OHA75_12780 [Streptomyces coelicoflavus]
MSVGENDLDSPSRMGGDLVGRVLHQLEKLPVSVSALSDAAFTVRVFRDEPRVDLVGLQNAGGLVEDGRDYRLRRIGHCAFTAPAVGGPSELLLL